MSCCTYPRTVSLSDLVVLLRRDTTTLSVSQLLHFVQDLWRHKVVLLQESSPLLLPVAGFAWFVVVNGGIVLGTRDTLCHSSSL